MPSGVTATAIAAGFYNSYALASERHPLRVGVQRPRPARQRQPRLASGCQLQSTSRAMPPSPVSWPTPPPSSPIAIATPSQSMTTTMLSASNIVARLRPDRDPHRHGDRLGRRRDGQLRRRLDARSRAAASVSLHPVRLQLRGAVHDVDTLGHPAQLHRDLLRRQQLPGSTSSVDTDHRGPGAAGDHRVVRVGHLRRRAAGDHRVVLGLRER